MRKLAPARVSYRDDFLTWCRRYMMTGSSHISLFEGPLHVDEIHVWFKLVNITHALPVPVYRQTDVTSKRVVVSRLHDTAARFRSGVKFSPRYKNRGDSRRHAILWWYHVNKYRAMRGNRSELALGRKSPRCHVNTRLVARFIEEMSYVFSFTFFFSTAHFHLALVAASTLVFQEKKSLLCLSLALDLCRPFSRWASLACHLLPLLIFCVLL